LQAPQRLDRLIDGHETMASMPGTRKGDTARAIVEIGAVEALVTNAFHRALAAIANGIVNLSAARSEEAEHCGLQVATFDRSHEAMLEAVAMRVLLEALHAEIIVLAHYAVNEFRLGEIFTSVSSVYATIRGRCEYIP
jgi:hypothetical protein